MKLTKAKETKVISDRQPPKRCSLSYLKDGANYRRIDSALFSFL
jgi:hypothetical protein